MRNKSKKWRNWLSLGLKGVGVVSLVLVLRHLTFGLNIYQGVRTLALQHEDRIARIAKVNDFYQISGMKVFIFVYLYFILKSCKLYK